MEVIVIIMASLYAPKLTRWPVAKGGGGVHDYVEYEGKPFFLSREDCRRLIPDDTCECLEIAAKAFPLMEERTMLVRLDGIVRRAVRCMEYVDDDGSVILLTVMEGKEKEVAVVDAHDGGEVGCGAYYDGESGTVEHMVDVEGACEAYMLLVSVHEELVRIVRTKRLN